MSRTPQQIHTEAVAPFQAPTAAFPSETSRCRCWSLNLLKGPANQEAPNHTSTQAMCKGLYVYYLIWDLGRSLEVRITAPYFTREDTGAQRGKVTYSRSHSQYGAMPGFCLVPEAVLLLTAPQPLCQAACWGPASRPHLDQVGQRAKKA